MYTSIPLPPHSFLGFRKSVAHQRMVGHLARSPEFVPLDPMEVLADDDMRHYFMLYLMSARCVPASLSACLLACLPACLPACLLACLPACLPA